MTKCFQVVGVLKNSLVNCHLLDCSTSNAPLLPRREKALEAALLGRTSFAIAHRLTTIQGATIRATHGYFGQTDGSRTDWQFKPWKQRHTNLGVWELGRKKDLRVGCNWNWMVVSNIYSFHSCLGEWSNLTSIFFQMGSWNHQLASIFANLSYA